MSLSEKRERDEASLSARSRRLSRDNVGSADDKEDGAGGEEACWKMDDSRDVNEVG